MAAARSRFTGEPSTRAPRLVRAKVSGERSHQNPSGSTFAAVKHTPLTAMLEPSLVSANIPRQFTFMRAPAVPTMPTSSTIPVNTSLLHVCFHRELIRRNGMQLYPRELDGVVPVQASRASGHRKRSQAAQNLRGVIKENFVGHARFERRPVQFAAGLDHQRPVLFGGQIFHQFPEIGASSRTIEHEHADAPVFERAASLVGSSRGRKNREVAVETAYDAGIQRNP